MKKDVVAQSIDKLPAHLRVVWTSVYAAYIQGRLACLADDEQVPLASRAADGAELFAWEAVGSGSDRVITS